MTSTLFNQLQERDKAEITFNDAQYLQYITVDGKILSLYKYETFFIEVIYQKNPKQIEKIHALSSPSKLYLYKVL